MDLGLAGRTALVLGASKGLGLACAQALAEEDEQVVMVARDQERLSNAAGRIGAIPVVVLIASASVREPIPNLVLSNTVRPGVQGYLKTLSRELGPDGITVNTVAPGRLATDRMTELYGGAPPAEELSAIPLGRFGDPRELGDVVTFLCSRQASYLTGITVPVDGGSSHGLT